MQITDSSKFHVPNIFCYILLNYICFVESLTSLFLITLHSSDSSVLLSKSMLQCCCCLCFISCFSNLNIKILFNFIYKHNYFKFSQWQLCNMITSTNGWTWGLLINSGQWQCLGTSYKFIKNWDANYERNLEESVICIIFYAVILVYVQ